jgi:hypothetical protein
MNRLQSERDEIASEKRGFHMTIEGDLRHFHNQCIDDARSDVIEIRRVAEGDPLDFEVVVGEGRGETRHRVTMSREMCERLTAGKHTCRSRWWLE